MSNVTRSVSITVTNATKDTLTCTPEAGADFNGGPIPPYSQKTYIGQSQSQAVGGCLLITGPNGYPNYSLWYEASSNSDNTYFRADASTGSLYTYQKHSIEDHSVDVAITLYEGVQVDPGDAGTGYAIELAPADSIGDQMACAPWVFRDFVEQMFASGVRTALLDRIAAEAPNVSSAWASQNPVPRPPVYYADMTGGQIPKIVDILTAYWLDSTKPCAASDKRLIAFFKGFFTYSGFSSLSSTVIPQIYLPRFDFVRFEPADDPDSTLPVFELQAYDSQWIRDSYNQWSEDVVRSFLTLLVSGAHFAVLRYSGDGVDTKFADAMDFRQVLTDSQLETSDDLGNSHYTSGLNMTGYYYLDISGESLPAKVDDGYETDWSGLLISLMTALTNAGAFPGDEYNTFFQLEGWPAHGLTGGDRHAADYQASIDTYWNVSTFGASPYSEKRGGSVFIAPPGWTPEVTQVTYMMPYYGAWAHADGNDQYSPQGWFQTELIEIDESTAQAFDTDLVQN